MQALELNYSNTLLTNSSDFIFQGLVTSVLFISSTHNAPLIAAIFCFFVNAVTA
jgi:hypothetical protein